jgi:hypothetical protein
VANTVNLVDEFDTGESYENSVFNGAIISNIEIPGGTIDNSIKKGDIKLDIGNIKVEDQEEIKVTIQLPRQLSVYEGTNFTISGATAIDEFAIITDENNTSYVGSKYPDLNLDISAHGSNGIDDTIVSNNEVAQYKVVINNSSEVDAYNSLLKLDLSSLTGIGVSINNHKLFKDKNKNSK